MSVESLDARQRFQRLTEVSRALTAATSRDEVAKLAVQTTVELVDADRVVLLATDEDGAVVVLGSYGLSASAAAGFVRHALDDGLSSRLAALLETTSEHFLGVPLVVDDQLTGMLAARTKTTLRDEAEWLFAALADQTSVALEKTRLAALARLRERVVGIVSHDLRNPINAVSIAASMLLRRSDLDPQALRLIQMVSEGAARAGRMVHDLLDYTAASLGGGIAVEKSARDLRPAVDQIVDELTLAHPNTVFEVQAADSLPGVWDGDRLAQAVGNLLSNAVRYATDHRVRLVVWTEAGTLRVEVHNRGPVIAPEVMSMMFEPMRRAVLEGETGAGKVGLGLYIVKHIAEAHGGSVNVRSTAAEGTVVTFEVPVR